MFANARKPTVRIPKEDGKTVGAALEFIANKWATEVNFQGKAKRSVKDAFAGGFSLLKLNNAGGELWLDALRADRFYFEKTGRGDLRKVSASFPFMRVQCPRTRATASGIV